MGRGSGPVTGATDNADDRRKAVDLGAGRPFGPTTVPAGATTGPITVTDAAGSSNSLLDFTVTPPGSPALLAFTPTSGHVGNSVEITGMSFTGTTDVAFNGTAALFSEDSDTTITATVPTGATTGPIEVTTAGGTATSALDFTVTDTTDVHARRATMRLHRDLVARGRVFVRTGFDRCLDGVPVVLRYRGARAWHKVGTDTTNQRGR